ncbi:MAG: hypothetical protein AAFY69_09715 [Pseudomonadota bacterium]
MSLPLTRAGVVDVAAIRAALAARISTSALAQAAPQGPSARQPLDTSAAMVLLRRASAGWLRTNTPAWQPLLTPAPSPNGAPPATDPGTPAVIRTATLEVIRTVILEVGNALQAAARSDLSRDAILRAVRLLLAELRHGFSTSRDAAGEPRSTTIDTAASWAPYAPFTPPDVRRARRPRARLRAAGNDDDVDEEAAPASAHEHAPGRESTGREAPQQELLDILRWLERQDGSADYGWLAGGGQGAPTGRVVDDSA